MMAFHNSHSFEYRKPFGAVKTGETVWLSLDVSADTDISCDIILRRDGEDSHHIPMNWVCEGRYSASFTAPTVSGLLWYYFAITGTNGTFYYGNNTGQLGGVGQLSDIPPLPYQITVYKDTYVPDWFSHAIVYQIFPDRFCRGSDWEYRRKNAMERTGRGGPYRVFQENWDDKPFYTKNDKGEITRWAFFGGTIEGIREKLLYLKSLGVSAVYLNPIFKASSNHKYDTADYMSIDPGFGDGESFRAFIQAAKAFGISVILDGVFSHTGADSIYFDRYGNYGGSGAYLDKNSPYFSWFSFENYPEKYDCWWGVADLPKTDKSNPTFRDFIYGKNGVVRRWLKEGIRGWRLDVADELPDDFIKGIRQAMTDENPDSVLIGEVWEDASNKISYGERRKYLLGGALDSVMNYPFRRAALDYMCGRCSAQDLAAKFMSLAENYPPANFRSVLDLIGSHDRVRIITRLGDAPDNLSDIEKEQYALPPDKYYLAKRRLMLLSLLQFTIPGAPCIYYGDEAGLQGFEDPFNRSPFPWGLEDTELTQHYRTLSILRRQYKPITDGDFKPEGLTEHVFSVRRSYGDEQILILINRGIFEHETVTVSTGTGYVLDLLTSEEHKKTDGKLTLHFEPLSAKVLYLLPEPPVFVKPERAAGILCHISSIPSINGTATTDAFWFIDFLAESGQKLWQLLPLNPAGKGNSPFYSPSVFAIGKHFTDDLKVTPDEGFELFCEQNKYWLDDYALFMSLTDKNSGKPWQEWPENEKNRLDLNSLYELNKDSVLLYKLVQYGRNQQWETIKAYANDRGITVIGDLPVYVSPDGADVWAHRELFRLKEAGYPLLHAAVPPDYFNPDGQDWGNPLYDWDNACNGLYLFWENRFRRALQMCDTLRLDHYRSFSAYFAVPEGGTPKDGYWLCGEGINFFNEMKNRLGSLPFIAEDLGVLDAGVNNLLKLTALRGMNVWQFSAPEMESMSESEAERRIFYSGTHDNQTLVGWCSDNITGVNPVSAASEIIEKLYFSHAGWVITPLQDVLLLGDEARMNTPGTVGGNWAWKASESDLTTELRTRLSTLAVKSRRL